MNARTCADQTMKSNVMFTKVLSYWIQTDSATIFPGCPRKWRTDLVLYSLLLQLSWASLDLTLIQLFGDNMQTTFQRCLYLWQPLKIIEMFICQTQALKTFNYSIFLSIYKLFDSCHLCHLSTFFVVSNLSKLEKRVTNFLTKTFISQTELCGKMGFRPRIWAILVCLLRIVRLKQGQVFPYPKFSSLSIQPSDSVSFPSVRNVLHRHPQST